MASFQSKIRMRRVKREKTKIIVSFRPYPTRNRKFKEIATKIQKIKKYHYGIVSSKNRMENDETERK